MTQPDEHEMQGPTNPDRPFDEIEEGQPASSPEDISRRKFVGFVGLAALMTVALGVGANSLLRSEKTAPNATANNAPDTTPKKSVETTAQAEARAFEDRVNSYEKSMNKYKEMTVDEFELLPRKERLAYAQFLIDQTVSRGNYDSTYGPGKPGADYAVKPPTVSKNNTGQEILDCNMYNSQISALQFKEGEVKPFDPIDGCKVLSSVFYEVGKDNNGASQGYDNAVDKENSLEEPIWLTDKVTATDTSELLKGTDSKGKEAKYKIVTYSAGDGITAYTRFVLCTFTSYDGAEKSLWLIDDTSTSPYGLDALGSIH